MELHGILSVQATEITDVFVAEVDVTNFLGEREIVLYGVVPGDDNGLAPLVRDAVTQWVADGNPVVPYTPPTPEQIRAAMPPLSARQLRLGLVANGLSIAAVEAAIEAIQDPTDKATAQIEWEYATQFNRSHPLISQIGAALSLNDEEIDTMWMGALSL